MGMHRVLTLWVTTQYLIIPGAIGLSNYTITTNPLHHRYNETDWRRVITKRPVILNATLVRATVCERAMTNLDLCGDISNDQSVSAFLECPIACNLMNLTSTSEIHTSMECNVDVCSMVQSHVRAENFSCTNCSIISNCGSPYSHFVDGFENIVIDKLKSITTDLDVRSQESLFRETFTRNVIYLKSIFEDEGRLSHVYCRRRNFPELEGLSNETDLNQEFICYGIPSLDSWWNVHWIIPHIEVGNEVMCLKVQYHGCNRNCQVRARVREKALLKKSYWHAPQNVDDVVKCGKLETNTSIFEVAIHLRVADLIAGSKHHPRYGIVGGNSYPERLDMALYGLSDALKYVDSFARYLPRSHPIRLLIVSDLPYNTSFDDLDNFIRTYRSHFINNGIILTPTRNANSTEGMSPTILLNSTLSYVPIVELMLDSNPLVSLHCLVRANLTIESSIFNFSKVVRALTRGLYLEPTIAYSDEDKRWFQKKLAFSGSSLERAIKKKRASAARTAAEQAVVQKAARKKAAALKAAEEAAARKAAGKKAAAIKAADLYPKGKLSQGKSLHPHETPMHPHRMDPRKKLPNLR